MTHEWSVQVRKNDGNFRRQFKRWNIPASLRQRIGIADGDTLQIEAKIKHRTLFRQTVKITSGGEFDVPGDIADGIFRHSKQHKASRIRFSASKVERNHILHLLQGGIKNGDMEWLLRAKQITLRSPSWIAPKNARLGDRAVIYVQNHGFFATARLGSGATSRKNWPRRYGAALDSIQLIEPPIPLETIRKKVPKLAWAKYPRSITTLPPRYCFNSGAACRGASQC